MLTHVLFRQTKKSAKEAADRLREQGYKVSVEPAGAYRWAGYIVKAWTLEPEN